MNKYNNLIRNIADEFNISQGKTEKDESWMARVIYSLLGRMGYSSLWDIQEDYTPITITHFKRRIESVFESYSKMYPDVCLSYFEDAEHLSADIYDIFLKTGNIYHSSYRISVSTQCVSEASGIYFTRGMALNQRQFVSGVGSYLCNNENTIFIQPSEMFQLQENSIIEQWEFLLSNIKWRPITAESRVEYLRTKPPFFQGYWINSPDITGEVSLARINYSGKKVYYLYKMENGRMMGSQLPEWKVEDFNYRTVANGCLAAIGCLPATTYHIDGEIAQVTINYLFPPAELNLIKLYSWPKSYVQLPQDFNRTFELQVFLAIRDILKPIGYQFVEV